MSATPPASLLTLQQFQQEYLAATKERDRVVNERKNNLWKGPMSLEEYIQFALQDVAMASMAIQGLMEILVQAELAKQAGANDPA